MTRQGEDYSKDSLTLQREERALERKKAKEEASKNNFKKTLSNLLKQEEVKKIVARDGVNASKNMNSDNIFRLAMEGTNRGYHDREVITGNEDKLWEREIE